MRLRNIKGAREKMEESTFVLTEDKVHKGCFREIFNNENPIHIEVGSGKGNFIITKSRNNPHINYVGIEKYSSVLIKLLKKQEEEKLNNLHLLRMDATEIEEAFECFEVEKIYLNFSDPWPKDRHAKRRLTSHEFLKRYEKILKDGSLLEFKTDNVSLFDFSLESISTKENWEVLYFTKDLYSDDEQMKENVPTEYEKKFVEDGNKINKLIAIYRKNR